jgi:hypothetical protein
LNIPTLVVFDNDKGCGSRLCAPKSVDAAAADANERTTNRRILAYLDLPEEDYPEGQISPVVHVWADRIEEVIAADWPAWAKTHQEIVEQSRGVPGKNAATYALAARECPDDPDGALTQVIAAARTLAGS